MGHEVENATLRSAAAVLSLVRRKISAGLQLDLYNCEQKFRSTSQRSDRQVGSRVGGGSCSVIGQLNV